MRFIGWTLTTLGVIALEWSFFDPHVGASPWWRSFILFCSLGAVYFAGRTDEINARWNR